MLELKAWDSLAELLVQDHVQVQFHYHIYRYDYSEI